MEDGMEVVLGDIDGTGVGGDVWGTGDQLHPVKAAPGLVLVVVGIDLENKILFKLLKSQENVYPQNYKKFAFL